MRLRFQFAVVEFMLRLLQNKVLPTFRGLRLWRI